MLHQQGESDSCRKIYPFESVRAVGKEDISDIGEECGTVKGTETGEERGEPI